MTPESEPETGTETPGETPPENQPETGTEKDLSVELDHWREQARKQEARAKANATAAKELEQLKKQSMSESEKAIAEARAEERMKVAREFGIRLVDSELRNAAVGRGIDVDALIEGVDRSRFVGDDFEPKRDEIKAWLDKVAPLPKEEEESKAPDVPMLDLGQGSRSTTLPLNGDPLERKLREMLGIR